MAKAREDRFRSAEEFAEALSAHRARAGSAGVVEVHVDEDGNPTGDSQVERLVFNFEDVARGYDGARVIIGRVVDGLDIMIVRELTGGVYFGEPKEIVTQENGEKRAVDTTVYTTSEIERIVKVR